MWSDKLIWGLTSNGKFSVKSAYHGLTECGARPNPLWKIIWNLHIPPKIQIFAWTVVHERVLTNVQRVKRNLTSDSSCHMCPGKPETLLHLFRDCARAKHFWLSIQAPNNLNLTLLLDWKSWLSANAHCSSMWYPNLTWQCFFFFGCWFLWKWRNKAIFDPAFRFPPNLIRPKGASI